MSMAGLKKLLSPAGLQSGFKRFCQGELQSKTYDYIANAVISTATAILVPILRYFLDPPETRNRLFVMDFTGNMVGVGIVLGGMSAIGKIFENKFKLPAVIAGCIGILLGNVFKTVFQGIGALKVADVMDRTVLKNDKSKPAAQMGPEKPRAVKRLNTVSGETINPPQLRSPNRFVSPVPTQDIYPAMPSPGQTGFGPAIYPYNPTGFLQR